MNKKLLLFTIIALVLIVSLNSVSAYFHYPQYNTDDFRETTEFKRTTIHKTGDFWNYESTKRTVTEKTEVRKRTRTPTYSYYNYPGSFSYSPYSYGRFSAPSSSWRFKEPYINRNYINSRFDDYYYKPRFDSNLGYYNWRW